MYMWIRFRKKKSKRKIKKTVVNLVNLKNRVNNALETEAYKKLYFLLKYLTL